MHDQSASRISGRTRAAVSAMSVRALRITVLKSAGNFTRDECNDLSAEKIQRVKCFVFTRYGICCVPQFSNAGAAGCVRKFQAVVNWRTWRGRDNMVDRGPAAAGLAETSASGPIAPVPPFRSARSDTRLPFLARNHARKFSGDWRDA